MPTPDEIQAFVARLNELGKARGDTGNPIRGKLKGFWINITNEGWQAIATFYFIERWNTADGPDPLTVLMDVIMRPPDPEPMPKDTPLFIRQPDTEPEHIPAPVGDLEDLLG